MIPPAMQVRTLSESDWPDTKGKFRDVTFEQSLSYGRPAAARVGAHLRLVVVEDDSGICAAAALRLRLLPGLGRGIAWLPSGPLIQPLTGLVTDDAKLEGILVALRREFCSREGNILRLRFSGVALLDPARVRAVATRAGFTPYTGRPPYRSYVLDLAQEADVIMRGLSQMARRHLRFSIKSGLALVCGSGPAFEARFMALFERVQAAKGFRPDITPQFHFDAIAKQPTSSDYRLNILIATKGDQDVAGTIVGTCGHVATYLFGATAEEGRSLRAGYFLAWEAVMQARAGGASWYDLGGVDFNANPDVARFKEGMGGEWVEAEVFQAIPRGPIPRLIMGLEALRGRFRERR